MRMSPALGRRFWTLLLAGDLAVLGVAVLLAIVQPGSSEGGSGDVVAGALVLAFLLAFIPHRWLCAHRGLSRGEGWLALGLRRPAPWDIAAGLVAGAILLLVLISLGLLASWMGMNVPEGRRTAQHAHWVLLLFLPLLIGSMEEIFFRGFLFKYTGWLGQALLFTLFHAPYPSLLHVLMPLAAGIWFGWLRLHGFSLWTTITGHALYDAFLFALSAYRS